MGTGSTMMWQERILVVSGDGVSNITFKTVLEKEGLVDIAGTLQHALDFLSHDYCAAIVVNADSTGIDAQDFYRKALDLYPSTKDRFLFVTKNPKNLAFYEKNGLKCVKELSEVKDAVMKILSR